MFENPEGPRAPGFSNMVQIWSPCLPLPTPMGKSVFLDSGKCKETDLKLVCSAWNLSVAYSIYYGNTETPALQHRYPSTGCS